jgi:hypothetical protein
VAASAGVALGAVAGLLGSFSSITFHLGSALTDETGGPVSYVVASESGRRS